MLWGRGGHEFLHLLSPAQFTAGGVGLIPDSLETLSINSGWLRSSSRRRAPRRDQGHGVLSSMGEVKHGPHREHIIVAIKILPFLRHHFQSHHGELGADSALERGAFLAIALTFL
jgi:hypothetical protein